jgi:hypothetical protein
VTVGDELVNEDEVEDDDDYDYEDDNDDNDEAEGGEEGERRRRFKAVRRCDRMVRDIDSALNRMNYNPMTYGYIVYIFFLL